MLRIIFIVLMLAHLPSLYAFERAEMRGLQDGPVGRGSPFARVYHTEFEAAYGYHISQGAATGSQSALSGDALTQTLDAGAGYVVNDNLNFISFANFTSQKSDFSTDKGVDYSFQRDRSFFEAGAGPALDINGLIFGGYVSIVHFNEETTDLELGEKSATQVSPQASVPFLSLHGGVSGDLLSLVLGFRTFNQAKVEKEITDQDGLTTRVSSNRSRPGEVWVDGMSKVSENVSLSLSVTVVTYSQSSEVIGNEHVGVSDPEVERNNDKRRANQFNLALGGAYRANTRLSLLSSLRYVSPSYTQTEYASLSEENLGGYKINVGSNLDVDPFHLNFLAGYLIPKKETYTVRELSATPWATEGERISIEQPKWTLSVGASLPL